MSSRDLSRVVALSCKALELQKKGHYARSMEKCAAAIAAAQELAQEDCLVVTHLQLLLNDSLLGYVRTPGVAAEAGDAAERQGFQVLVAAIATLERRRAAGTLLAGKCRKWPEEEWYGHVLQHRQFMVGHPVHTPEVLALLVPFVGYDAYLDAASDAVSACVAESAPSHVLELWHLIALHAIHFMEQRIKISEPDIPLSSEIVLASFLHAASESCGRLKEHGPHSSLPTYTVEMLTRWQIIERSGVLQERGIVASAVAFRNNAPASTAAREARLAAATLRCCSLGSCGARELHPGHYKHCGACRGVAYCCREHQLEDWPAHKAACKAARKAAAEEAGRAA